MTLIILSGEEIIAVEHLILCTVKHGLEPGCTFVGEWADSEQMKELFQRHAGSPSASAANNLTEIFLDLDLAVLGTSPSEYDEYAVQIRQEYIHYCWEEYAAGRRAVLNGFLAREWLYFTDHFRQRYEMQARKNLQRELDNL